MLTTYILITNVVTRISLSFAIIDKGYLKLTEKCYLKVKDVLPINYKKTN